MEITHRKLPDKKVEFKKLIAFLIAILILLIFMFIVPIPDGLSRASMAAVGLLLACIILWVSEAVPLLITVIFILIMLPITGVTPLSDVYTSFMTPVVFFCFVSFALSAAIVSTPIPLRVANKLFKWSGNSPRKVIFGFVFCCAALSAFMSNLAAVAIFMSLVLTILKANGDPQPGTTQLGKALMIGIAGGAAIGGFSTPIGNSLNILAMEMIQSATGIRVTFLDWLIAGVPCAIIACLFLSWWLCFFFKPESIREEAITVVREELSDLGKMHAHEKKVILWIVILFVFWLASTWVASFNLIVIGLIGLVVAFIPGVSILQRDHYFSCISWDVIFMIGGVQALAMGIINTGAAQWFVDTLLAGAGGWPILAILLVMSAITAILHICIPVGPPVVSLALPVLLVVAAITGVDALTLCLIVGIHAGVTLILPIDSIALITYSKGYYRMKDMAVYGIVPTIFLVILSSTVVPLLAKLLGY